MTPQEEAKQAFTEMEQGMVDPALPPTGVPANSPLSEVMREALVWARHHGVLEMELKADGSSRFIMRPGPEAVPPPTAAEIAARLNGSTPSEAAPAQRPTTAGGYDPDILFASSPVQPR